ncbi:MAG: PaaI family thioesterase [Sphingomonadaceae bacterium]|uniref:PaaI family thioesterase n=1 Tax=Thermaurantiacus sp. TaxID=2820283 RepID=UPI00298F1321|nr:PaaI family thioesterase [Thermaurantiacus sp.]MCS6987662.1 PaaI family thioesterase [Sphingomonadaceae bacterium]MDW8415263.1 PaaI family thioesterase [Thermaurantiacus sp.]
MSEEHRRRLERLYASAPVNRVFPSTLHLPAPGRAEIRFRVEPDHFHAAGAAHGTLYFKMLDDAAFYAAATLVDDVFVLTTQFNLVLTRPLGPGEAAAYGQWVSGHRRVLIAESRLVDASGQEVARGTGTFMRSRIALAHLPAYADPLP